MKRFLIVFILLVVLSSGVQAELFSGKTSGAQYVQHGPSDFRTYYGAQQAKDYWPILYSGDENVCEGRQDLIIQVAPAGCQPSVVRSDLLGEQNVPVFCQLDGFRVNPLIDIKQIRNIHFSFTNKPKEVVDVGFHPARAALQTRNQLVGNPLLTNLGYIVIVLKKNANESNLPDFLNFTVGARLEYSGGNAFGIGKTSFLLKPSDDEEWKVQRNRQSFFKGQYFVRLDDADAESARVSIYKGDRRIGSTTVGRGKTSSDMYIEGAYCQARIQIAYDGFKSAEKTVRLQVDGDVFELLEGGAFLNDKCRVNKIIVDGAGEGNVEVRCEGSTFELRLSPKSFVRGDEVYLLGKDEMVDYDLGVWKIDKVNEPTDKEKIASTTYDLIKVDDAKKTQTISALNVRAASADKLVESLHTKELEGYFEQTIDTYKNVAEDYPLASNESIGEPFGEQALERAIGLADELGKQQTAVELIGLYLDIYANSSKADYYTRLLEGQYGFNREDASVSVEVDNGVHIIQLIEVNEPAKKASAEFSWGGERFNINLKGSNGIDKRVNFTLDTLDVDSAGVTAYCYNRDKKIYEQDKSYTLEIGRGLGAGIDARRTQSVCEGVLKIEEINLEQFAQVRILPSVKGTQVETNVTVGVGIEKRALKLTPDKTKERIEELNKTIARWDKISSNLGNVVKGMKAACFATAGVLTVKNFVTGLDGEALARQKVMRSSGGWSEWCGQHVKSNIPGEPSYDSIGECYAENTGAINQDVQKMTTLINADNQKIKSIEASSGIKTSSDLFGTTIDGEKAKNQFVEQELGSYGQQTINVSGTNVLVSTLTAKNGEKRALTYDEAKDLKLYLDMKAQSNSIAGKNLADENLERIARRVSEQQKFTEVRGNLPIKDYDIRNRANGFYSGKTIGDWQKLEGVRLAEGNFGPQATGASTPSEIISYGNKLYLVTFDSVPLGNGNYRITSARELEREGDLLNPTGEDKTADIQGKFNTFRKTSATDCKNVFKNPEIKFYETEPYKGLPALVPFDIEEGWYAATQQTLPGFGNIKVFQSNGRPVSFWVCNVGGDGEADFFVSGLDDDICQRFDVETGAPLDAFSCLGESETKQIVVRAQQALMDAARQRGAGSSRINIEGAGAVKVGAPAVNLPGTQCQDFMSPDDCKLLFNVCDPVICPSSRCNFGGQYPVPDVIQTGIVGSALLCLPNWNEGVYIPVCLTGIKAGIDGYLSILKSHQLCLQESVDTGRYVGTCDLVTSVYLCEFFWRQAAPVANVLLPKLVEFAYGQGQARGGGEYLTVQSAWDNTQASVNYFTQSYAVNSLQAFKIRSIDEAGSEFCRAFVSAKAPTQFESLIEPDSPTQFHAWFSSIPFSDATVPATSQYKVFYHIFAGNDQGVSFSVYLKDPPQTSYYQTQPTIIVATGFVPRGQFATETKDFTAPLGYQQLCVRHNDKEECGFKQVSTSFAINTVRDEFVNDELKRENINSEKTCVSGQLNPSSLLNPNIQEGAQEAIDPAIYNRGITRICATENPGRSTEPTRFTDVGYCSDERVRCWLDSRSVDKALTPANIGLKNETLSELQARADGQLREAAENGGYYVGDSGQLQTELGKAVGSLGETISSGEGQAKLDALDELLTRAVYTQQKAQVLFVKGTVYEAITRGLQVKIEKTSLSGTSNTISPTIPSRGSPWTWDSALTTLNSFRETDSYSVHANFINQLYEDKLLSDAEFLEINGEGWLKFEKNMLYVKEIIVKKRILGLSDEGIVLEKSYDPKIEIYLYSKGAKTSVYLFSDKVYCDSCSSSGLIGSVINSDGSLSLKFLNSFKEDIAKTTLSFEQLQGAKLVEKNGVWYVEVSSGAANGGATLSLSLQTPLENNCARVGESASVRVEHTCDKAELILAFTPDPSFSSEAPFEALLYTDKASFTRKVDFSKIGSYTIKAVCYNEAGENIKEEMLSDIKVILQGKACPAP